MNVIAKDRLFLLKADFTDKGITHFCTECAMVEGMLSFYPHIRPSLDIRYVKYARPRPEIVAELGPDNQSSPVLIIGDPGRVAKASPNVRVQTYEGKHFVNDPYMVCEYLASVHGVGRPH